MIQSRLKAVRGGASRAGSPDLNTQRLTSINIPEEAPSISVLDESNRFSLINLVPPAFADRLRVIPKEYFTYSEQRLCDEVKPDDVLNKLKLRFWDEWQTSILAGITARVSITAIYYGVCTEEYFHEHVLTSPKNMAWVVVPPTDYVLTMRDILRQGMGRLREIVQLPISTQEPIMIKSGKDTTPLRDEDGKVMMKTVIQKGVISEIRQIVQLLSDRVHGAVVQRLDVQSKSLTMEVSPETAHLLANSGGTANNHGLPLAIEAKDVMDGFTNSELQSIELQLRQLNSVLSATEERVVTVEMDTGVTGEESIDV